MAGLPDFDSRRIVLRDDRLPLRRSIGLACLAYAVLYGVQLAAGGRSGDAAMPARVFSTALDVLWWLSLPVAAWALCLPATTQILDVDRRVLLQSANSISGIHEVAIPFDDFSAISVDSTIVEDGWGGSIITRRLMGHRKIGAPIELGDYARFAPYIAHLSAIMGLAADDPDVRQSESGP